MDFNKFAEIKKEEVVTLFQKEVIADLKVSYPFLKEENMLSRALDEIHQKIRCPIFPCR